MENSIKNALAKVEDLIENTPRLLILGIGENRMGDDGIGPYICFKLSMDFDNEKIKVVNGGITPEERMDEVVEFQPNLIIVIDAIDDGKPKGSVNLYDHEQMLNYLPISSHSLPLPIFMSRLVDQIPGVTIKLLGICPFSMCFLDTYQLYKEDEYTLDEKENDPNIPFYSFNLSSQIKELGLDLITQLKEVFGKKYL